MNPDRRGNGDGARLRVLGFFYDCRPGAGSEPGAGWVVLRSALRSTSCIALVPPRHGPALRAWAADHPEVPLRVEEVPEVRWYPMVQFHRIGRFLAYLGWLRNAAHRARRLVAAGEVDVAWHGSYSAMWLPTPAASLGVPSVWGPVGGGVTAAPGLRGVLGWRGVLSERLDALAVRLMASLPATRRTWRRATVRLLQNEDSRRLLPPRLRADSTVLNHALFVEPAGRHAPGGTEVLWVGALEPRKGPGLAIRALAASDPGVRMRMYGDGPERSRLERLAQRLGVTDRLEFAGHVPRAKLQEALTGCRAALFTGLYEEGGLALAEALATGVPAIVLDHGGAGTIARRATDPARVVLVPPQGVAATAARMGAELSRLAAPEHGGGGPLLDRAQADLELAAALRRAAGGPR